MKNEKYDQLLPHNPGSPSFQNEIKQKRANTHVGFIQQSNLKKKIAKMNQTVDFD